MNCREVGWWLDAYVDDELGLDESAQLNEHLERCPACRHRLAELESLGRLVRSLPHYTAPKRLRDAVAAGPGRWWLRTHVQRSTHTRSRGFRYGTGFAAECHSGPCRI
jgi:anti-sigma factor RsiW